MVGKRTWGAVSKTLCAVGQGIWMFHGTSSIPSKPSHSCSSRCLSHLPTLLGVFWFYPRRCFPISALLQSKSRVTYWPCSRLSVGRTRVTFREGCWIMQVMGYSRRILEWVWVKLLMTVTVWLLNFMWYSLGFCCRMLGRYQVIFGAGFPVAEQLIPTIFSESSALSGLDISLVSTLGSEMAVKNKVTKSLSFCLCLSKEHLYLQLSWRKSLLSNLSSPFPKPQQWQINMKVIRQ